MQTALRSQVLFVLLCLMVATGISCACFAAVASAADQIQRVRKAGHTAGGHSCPRPTPLVYFEIKC
ncbi:hypothetical protein PF005_g15412 [Phytophthora fragariae]|uniref:RxLR effector protein n=1 Tax=Phytophthora fragariae TaxID=53985 RepID=A0A6A3ERL6_9STRA|nr:hypothetical protein PF003_g29740 [Phytophthora fragariae]KAE8934060.1 hypothetical protein PF009_g15955 [Phytophthora fragariae]KAE9081462.1 hypothetical protein PF007_g22648 [Phytophthora fragariae]KAE9134362.1 hypothetical protein PF006_g14848 [Phytophthora fragariae]KAE9200281.1 hypothetical protein PF005_g15412 [Phytophthora fragariae]